MKIICPNCRQAVAGVDIDLANGRALCRPCGEVVMLPSGEPTVEGASRALVRAAPASLATLYRPERLDWKELRDGTTWRFETAPRRTPAIPWLFLTAMMLLLIIHWLSPPHVWSWFDLILLVPMPATIAFAYLAVKRIASRFCLALGMDHFELTGGRLSSRRLTEPVANIERFVGGETSGLLPNSSLETVKMLTRDGRSIELPLLIDQVDEARFISDRLNLALAEVRTPRTRTDPG